MDELQRQIDVERAQYEPRSIQYPSASSRACIAKENEHLPRISAILSWHDERKSKFIESILLGIPIPSIFVAQQPDGAWDVVDGLQRLSPHIPTNGVAKDDDKNLVAKLVLTKTKYLPAMDGMTWDATADGRILSNAEKLFIKRAKLDVKIVLRESSEKTKF